MPTIFLQATTDQPPKKEKKKSFSFFIIFNYLTVKYRFVAWWRGFPPKNLHILCACVIINKCSFEPFCIWILLAEKSCCGNWTAQPPSPSYSLFELLSQFSYSARTSWRQLASLPTFTSLTANQQFSYLVCVLHSLRLPSMCLTGFCDTIKSLSPQYHYQRSFKNPDVSWPRRLKQHRQPPPPPPPPPPRYLNSFTKCWPSLIIRNKTADVGQPMPHRASTFRSSQPELPVTARPSRSRQKQNVEPGKPHRFTSKVRIAPLTDHHVWNGEAFPCPVV